ncbi:nucleotidyltransferase family protein [Thermodesulfovibrio sp. 3907-1M]|uniref:Nucleotidyltransferase family protein n=1 Tax=Thermodesulfovibrio autotrophicus TaxID=3118333 RepID=A0AAU8GXW3_9BACT
MKTKDEVKAILEKHKDEIRKKYGVIIIGIFGSWARDEQKETSDVDILVEIERPIGLAFFELWDELEELLGCKVDLVRRSLLREEIKEDVLKEVVEI